MVLIFYVYRLEPIKILNHNYLNNFLINIKNYPVLGKPFFSLKNCPTYNTYYYKHLFDYVLTKDLKSCNYVPYKQLNLTYTLNLPHLRKLVRTFKPYNTVTSRVSDFNYITPLNINYLKQTKQTILFNNLYTNSSKPNLKLSPKNLKPGLVLNNTVLYNKQLLLYTTFSQQNNNHPSNYNNFIKYAVYPHHNNKSLPNSIHGVLNTLKSANPQINNKTTPLPSTFHLNLKQFKPLLQKHLITQYNTKKAPLNKYLYKDYFSPTKLSNFTLLHTGIFISKNLNTYKNVIKSKYKFLYKSRISQYSFLKPNQIKTLILKRKSSITYYKLINDVKFASLNILSVGNSTLNSLKTYGSCVYNTGTILNKYSYLGKERNSRKTLLSEVKIPRIRFKPGYQRMWRMSRLALKELVGVKFTYQKQLTKYLTRFFKKSKLPRSNESELSFDKIVIYSKIVPDYNSFSLFLKNKFFFLNGKQLFNKNVVCVVNDFIQLIVSKWYYVFFRWLLNWSFNRIRKVKRLSYKKTLSSRYTVMKTKKQRSNLVPDWVFTTKYDFSDIKPFIEVDYFTLSLFVIYEPYVLYYYPPTKLFSPNMSIYRLYNWKYIT